MGILYCNHIYHMHSTLSWRRKYQSYLMTNITCMCFILLRYDMYTRAQRNGLWNLNLFSFKCMPPYSMQWDHINCVRWWPSYLAELHHLPRQVFSELKKGYFVIKHHLQHIYQICSVQNQVWLNSNGRKSGSIVLITKLSASKSSRLTLSYKFGFPQYLRKAILLR